MSRVVLDMSMSVDGFIAGPDDEPGQGLGVGGEQLHGWLAAGDGSDPRSLRPRDEPGASVFDEAIATGAVISGRRTFELAGRWNGDHHDGVPVFVLTSALPAEPAPGHARWITDVEECAVQAKAAAGDRDVLLHGASAAQAFLRAKLVDDIQLHVVPVLMGQGRRLFDDLPAECVDLELVRALDGPDVLHLRYSVRSAG